VRDPLAGQLLTPGKGGARDAVNTEKEVVDVMSDAGTVNSVRDRSWLILGVIGLAQLMVVLDITVMNIALPSAQLAGLCAFGTPPAWSMARG
jgi:hypothetical protein